MITRLPYWVSPIRRGVATTPDGELRYPALLVDVALSRAQRKTKFVTCAVPINSPDPEKLLARQAVDAAQELLRG